jgi:hypothetical protein
VENREGIACLIIYGENEGLGKSIRRTKRLSRVYIPYSPHNAPKRMRINGVFEGERVIDH